MLRWTKWVAPVAALMLVAGFQAVRADDTATTTDGKATVTVTVVDANAKPVVGATVTILPAPAKKTKGTATTQPDGAKQARPTPLETGTTGADGTFALTKIPDGTFIVAARLQGSGTGRSRVTVADDKDETVSITLKTRAGKN